MVRAARRRRGGEALLPRSRLGRGAGALPVQLRAHPRPHPIPHPAARQHLAPTPSLPPPHVHTCTGAGLVRREGRRRDHDGPRPTNEEKFDLNYAHSDPRKRTFSSGPVNARSNGSLVHNRHGRVGPRLPLACALVDSPVTSLARPHGDTDGRTDRDENGRSRSIFYIFPSVSVFARSCYRICRSRK
jgi:hypothetical protein